ncbi:MAG: discoidin domain-containing protein, partial [Rhizobacter sp.]
VKLEEVSAVEGGAWAAVAEFNLIDANGANLPRDGWRASADSAAANDRPENAIDGDPRTLWHSQWEGVAPQPPHSLIVDLGHSTRFSGLRMLPRQDGPANGTIAKFRFYTSVNGVDWGRPVAEGDFSTMGPRLAEKTVRIR